MAELQSDFRQPATRIVFTLLPRLADYILKNRLNEFAREQLHLTFSLNYPAIKLFDLSKYTDDQLMEMSLPAVRELLEYAAANKLSEHLEMVIGKWVNNELPQMSREQLVVDDV